jgi:outer membrane protein
MRLPALGLVMLLYHSGVPGYDLLDAYQQALGNDPIHQAAFLRQQAEREKLPEARSFLLPNISADARQNRVDEKLSASGAPFVTVGTAEYNTHSYGVVLRQPLFDGAAFSGYRQAKLTVDIADLEVEIIRQDLLLRTAEDYIAVLQGNDNANLTKANEDAAAQNHEQLKNRYEVGLATRAEYQQAVARWQIAIADNITGQNILRDARRALERLTGSAIAGLEGLDSETVMQSMSEIYDLDIWFADVTSKNLDLLQSRLIMEVAEKNLSVQKSGYLPTLDLIVDYGANINDGSLSGFSSRRSSTTGTLLLDIPIFQGGRIVSRTRAARYSLEASQQEYDNTVQRVTQDALALFDNAISQQHTVDALGKAVEASVLAFEAKQEGFEAGLETNLNVLDAQRDLFQTALDLNRARYDSLVLRLQMEGIRGSLDEQDLAEINQLLTTPISNQLNFGSGS